MKKIKKKKVDIEKECEGNPVSKPSLKEKKIDLTSEIKAFLQTNANLESIKRILLRLEGPVSEFNVEKSIIKVYTFEERSEFLIVIKTNKYSIKYFFDFFTSYKLGFFSKTELETSELKSDLFFHIRKYLSSNPEMSIKLD